MSKSDRVAIVTGGGRGIGRGIVAELARRRFAVVVNYRSDSSAAEESCREAARLGAPATLAVAADIAVPEQGRALLEQTRERFGRLDLLVNNAGVAPAVRHDLLEMPTESWDRVLGINLRGPFLLTQEAARWMVSEVEAGMDPAPQIVFVTSVSSEFASINRGEYCVSKAGLSMVVRLFADRLAPHGIRVYEVRPGVIATDMTAAVKSAYDERIAAGLSPIRRWGTPQDVGLAVAAIAEGLFPFSTGEVLHVDGGLHLPRL